MTAYRFLVDIDRDELSFFCSDKPMATACF